MENNYLKANLTKEEPMPKSSNNSKKVKKTKTKRKRNENTLSFNEEPPSKKRLTLQDLDVKKNDIEKERKGIEMTLKTIHELDMGSLNYDKELSDSKIKYEILFSKVRIIEEQIRITNENCLVWKQKIDNINNKRKEVNQQRNQKKKK